MNHVGAYFGPKKCLSKQKYYICYKMKKPRKMTTRQYAGLVCDLNSRMAQMPSLFDEKQQLDRSELIDSLVNKAPRSHKAMLISQRFNPETRYLETFMKHCKRAETTENIAGAKFAASDEDSGIKRNKNRPKFKEQDKHGKKRHKKIFSLLLSPWRKQKPHTRDFKVLKASTKDKPKYSTKDYTRKSIEVSHLEKEASHQRVKYLKYKKLNKAFAKKKTRKEETFILDDNSDSNSSSSSEAQNSRDEYEEASIAYDSDFANDDESSNSSIYSK